MKNKDKYLIVLEKSSTGFSAYSPDVLGCIATSETIEKTIDDLKLALRLHLQAMLEDNEELPQPRGVESYLDAESASEGEEYYLTYIPFNSILPNQIAI